MSKPFLAALMICSICAIALAQHKSNAHTKHIGRLKKDQPTIFITFVREGKREPLYEGESNQGIWLRLHNNMSWPIHIPAFDVPKARGEVGFFYDVTAIQSEEVLGDSETGILTRATDVENVPVGYLRGHTYSPFRLLPGKSADFSVPREHLAKNLMISVSFQYDWEGKYALDGEEPKHLVSFSSAKLPSTVH